jgi:hypothetical protein
MAIRALTIQEFDQIRSARSALARATNDAVEWFADDTGLVIGAIAYHQVLLDWSFIVFERDNRGGFRSVACEVALRDLGEARRLLVENMARVKSTLGDVPSPHQPTAA